MGHDVFISYSSHDKAIADAVCAAIEQHGKAWMAPRNILPSRDYGGAIIDAIGASRLMVLVYSSHSNASTQVLREVERAVAKNVPIIQFKIENVPLTKEMEYFLSSPQWMDAFTPPIEAHIARLGEVVDYLLHAPPSGDGDPVQVPVRLGLHGIADTKETRRRALRAALTATAVTAVVVSAIAAGSWWLMRAPPEAIDPNAIAVMPFKNLSGDQAIDYLSTALPAELDSELTRSTTAIIRPLDSVMHYKDAPDVAKALHVGTIISGTFLHANEQLQITVKMTDTRQDRQVWAQSLQFALSDLLGLLDELIHKFVDALRLRMQGTPDDNSAGTANAQAYDLYLRGIALEQEKTASNNQLAIQWLERAVAADPKFARAFAALAEAYATRFWWNFSNDPKWPDSAESAARQALGLDPASPDAHVALGYALETKGNPRDAMAAYFASVRSAPNFLPGLDNAARFAFYMGDFPRALTMLDQAARIDPGKNIHIRKAMCFYFSGQLDAAASENREAERRAKGVDELTLVAFTYVWLKDFDSAERVLQRIVREEPGQLTILEIQAWLATMRGQIDEAHRLMREITSRRTEFGIMDEIATLYAIQGDGAQAIDWLTKAVAAGAANYAWYSSDFFKVLRGDPRYEAILTQLKAEYASVQQQ